MIGRSSLAAAGLLWMVCSVPLAGAQTVVDNAQVGMTGYIEDVCSVESINSLSSTGVVADFSGLPIGVGVETASLGFDFVVPNTTDPSAANIGAIGPGTLSVQIKLYCNGPFQFTLAATNGALANAKTLTNPTDFTRSLGYQVQVAFPDGTSAGPVAPAAPASNIIGPIVKNPQQGNLTLAISFTNGPKKLISGLYQEAVTASFVQDGVSPPSTFPIP